MPLLLDPHYPEQFDRVIKCFLRGHPVALPTETVYGLAAPISNIEAISRVFSMKGRPHFNPLVVHVPTRSKAKDYVLEFPEWAEKLAKDFWPGPLSLLLPKTDRVPDLVTAASSHVVLRCPSHPVFRNLLSRMNEAVVAPSANRYMGISPVSSRDVIKELGPFGLEAVVDGGVCQYGVESTIVSYERGQGLIILRPGAVTREALEASLGQRVSIASLQSSSPAVPGTAARHYSPSKPMCYLKGREDSVKLPSIEERRYWALLKVFPKDQPWVDSLGFEKVFYLSERASDVEAASNLFRVLRNLDEKEFHGIICCETNDSGLGLAINDRLSRASSKI